MTQVIENRAYGIDEASYQSTNITDYPGAKFTIVKTTEGLDYQNPKARAQIASAKNAGIPVGGYHYARFSADSSVAVQEGNYAVENAKGMGIPLGSIYACDWESDSGNHVDRGADASANAILAFMDTIAKAGYKPLLYSGKELLTKNINTKKITDKYGDCLWVAYYKTSGREDVADFNWFPSMDHVVIWQFTQNWKGMNVDANITVKKLEVNVNTVKPAPTKTTSTERTWTDAQGLTWHAEEGTFITGGAINLRWGATTQSMIITQLPAGSVVKYNAWARDSSGRVWLQQPRENNHYGYLVGRVGDDAWGTFK
ncbi:GH25 family lysozyme [Lactobacillus taiwanensis]|uniref:Lysin n=1 Tax=Lactobacillus taiwanensis TaxID=508451 RepID=A0A256LCB2_9LACO|nr:GH25 family lysozyme [Lactobacillus taiwanensis]OYR87447.1 lysin [Lactobacillus taiwanensis]OYR91065.1 lysin [Lactobacillus taiwanensis]OYR92527.1 lysin [Lactobacillus taiwanensis]OYR94474.1 lysin [Lactobacillus taiwanensis]